jgi:hypothetical protein
MLPIGLLYAQKAWKNDQTNWFVSSDECLEQGPIFIVSTMLHSAAAGSMNLDF